MMDINQRQAQKILARNLLPTNVVEWAYSSLQQGQGFDLCEVLVQQGYLNAYQASELREEVSAAISDEAGRRASGSGSNMGEPTQLGAPVPAMAHSLAPGSDLPKGSSPGSAAVASSSGEGPSGRESLLAQYELLGELGRGGMGVVYEGRHRELNARVAVKFLDMGPRGVSQEVRTRFELEAKAMARLRHPNIVRVLDVHVDEQEAFMVMELVEGGSLDRMLEQETRFELERALWITQKMAEALEHAHSRQIIHRDIKPANILINSEGDEVWLTDFGLAKALDEDRQLSRTGAMMGTLSYMPPEQVEGHHRFIDGRADIYALGVTLYEMLTGERPFTDEEQQSLVIAILFRPAPSPRRLRRDVPREVETIVARCLAKDREDRYQTAAELAEDLRRVLANEPILARPVGPLTRLRLWRRRNPRMFWLVALLGVLLPLLFVAAVIYFQTRQLRDQAAARLRAESDKRKLEAKEKIARERFNQVRSLARSLMFEIHDAIADLSGSLKARQLIVERARSYLEQLLKDAGQDAELRREVAEAYTRVGDIQGRQNHANLGQPKEALTSYKRAVSIFEGLDRSDERVAVGFAQVLGKLGDLQTRRQELGAGREALRRARALLEPLAEDGKALARLELSRVLTTLGLSRYYQGRPGDALKLLARGQAIADQIKVTDLPKERRIDLGLERIRGQAYSADAYEQQGLAESADKAFRSSIKSSDALFKAFPNNIRCIRTVAVSRNNYGVFLESQGRFDEALVVVNKALKVLRRLSEKNPGNVQFRFDLAVQQSNSGRLKRRVNDAKGGLALIKRAREALLEILREDPDNGDYRFHYGMVLRRLGEASVSSSPTEARAYFEAAARELKRGLANTGRLDSTVLSLCIVYANLARLAIADQDDATAREYFSEASKVLEVFEASPENIRRRLLKAQYQGHLVDFLIESRRFEEARRAAERLLRSVEHCLAKSPGNREAQVGLLIIQGMLAQVAIAQGRYRDALRLCQESERGFQGLKAIGAMNMELKQGRIVVFQQLANVYIRQGEGAKAVALLTEPTRFYEEILEASPGATVNYANAANLLASLSEAYSAKKDFTKAYEVQLRGIKVCEAWVRLTKSAIRPRRVLGLAHKAAAVWCLRGGRMELAGEHLKTALKLVNEVNTEKPGDLRCIQTLALLRFRYGEYLANRGPFEESVRWFWQSIEGFEVLKKLRPKDLGYEREFGVICLTVAKLMNKRGWAPKPRVELLGKALKSLNVVLAVEEEAFDLVYMRALANHMLAMLTVNQDKAAARLLFERSMADLRRLLREGFQRGQVKKALDAVEVQFRRRYGGR